MGTRMDVIPIETDVLIIGGGLAGCMGAIKAAESGLKVTIVEKSNTEGSGCAGTGIDHTWAYIPPVHERMGWTLEDLVEDHTQGIAGGLVRKDLIRLVASENYSRVLDLEKFGVNFRYPDSKQFGGFRIVPQFHSVPSTFNFDGQHVKLKLTVEARKRGVHIVNRVMATDLVSSDGHIAGALGVGTRDGKLYTFRAKAVVLSTGRVNRLTRNPSGVWGTRRLPTNMTGDGKSMALRAGIGVINMEFFAPEGYVIGGYGIRLGSPRNTTQPAGSITGLNGEVYVPKTEFPDWDRLGQERIDPVATRREWLARRKAENLQMRRLHAQGKGPFFLDLTSGSEEEIRYAEWSISNEAKGYGFLNYLKDDGIDFRVHKLEYLPGNRELSGTGSGGVVVDKGLETVLSGLFAAGDVCGGAPWTSASGGLTMGWYAGDQAAKHAAKQAGLAPVANDGKLEALSERCSNALSRKAGYHWSEVEQEMHNIVDYYAAEVRSQDLLRRGIDRLRDLRDNIAMSAENPHELARCLEVGSLLDNAEMILRGSLERKETRRFPYEFVRADFPEQDDQNYRCFLCAKLVDGRFEYSRIPGQ